MVLLGGFSSSLSLSVLLRFGRLRVSGFNSAIFFVVCILEMFTSDLPSWGSRLTEFMLGVALGIHFTVQHVIKLGNDDLWQISLYINFIYLSILQLITSETLLPNRRATFGVLNYVLFSFGFLAVVVIKLSYASLNNGLLIIPNIAMIFIAFHRRVLFTSGNPEIFVPRRSEKRMRSGFAMAPWEDLRHCRRVYGICR